MLVSVELTRDENAAFHGVKLGAVVALDIEEYLKGVLPAEIYESRTPMQAKYAQAVAARTYAARKALNGVTLTDTTKHQSYKAALIAKSPNCAEAVEQTRGLVLVYDGQVIQCYYSNSNGGRTKRTDEVWSAKLPYYKARDDPWDVEARRAAAAQGKTISAGHGVGLSQVGAEYAARLGESFADILAFYYPGADLIIGGGSAMSYTAKQLAEFAVKCYEDGVRYWYGTCYYKCTSSLLTSKTAQYPAQYTAARKSAYQADIKAGAMCCDCVGLIKGALWSNMGTRDAKYATNGCPDKSADGMLSYCKSKGMANGDMSTFPDEPGLLLHKSGHVGVSIGGGYAIEAKSFEDDVVRSKVAGRGWTSWARLPFVEYDGQAGGGTVSSAPVTSTGYKLGDRNLKNGSKGADVAELQAALVALGFDCGKYGTNKDGVDGKFGNTTEAAVRTFQKKAGLSVDGIYGPKSHAALLAMQDAGKVPENPEGGSPGEGGSSTSPTFTVTIQGVDAATATYLLETYAGATATEEGAV